MKTKKLLALASLMGLAASYNYSYGSCFSKRNPFGLTSNGMETNLSYSATDTSETEEMEEVLVSAQRFNQKRRYSPRQIEVVSAKKLAELQPATLGDALINTGQVFVQKSQQGGGSPVIRGFEASRIQLSIDGIRHNNAIFRSGHLQNSISFDNNALERVEVMSGPA